MQFTAFLRAHKDTIKRGALTTLGAAVGAVVAGLVTSRSRDTVVETVTVEEFVVPAADEETSDD